MTATIVADPPAAERVQPEEVTPGPGPAVGSGSPQGEGDSESELDANELVEPPLPPLRVGLVVAGPVIASALVVGAVFQGIPARVIPALAGIIGIGIAAQASRRRRVLAVQATIGLGIIGTGLPCSCRTLRASPTP